MKVSADCSNDSHCSGYGRPTVLYSCSVAPTTASGKSQALAQALDHWRSLRDLADDQLCLVVQDEAHDALGFLQRRDVLR